MNQEEIWREAEKLLGEIADFPTALIRFEENAFFIARVRWHDGQMKVVAAFSEKDLHYLRQVVWAIQDRGEQVRSLLVK